jgi:glycosyltransferase involved in cell wall biosynthesis/polysaccharide pyruvyl transferase WcaK-like protein
VLEVAFYLIRSLFILAIPSERWCRNDGERAVLDAFRSADLVISKGGGFIFGEPRLRSTARLYRVLFPMFLAWRLGRPYALLGQSLGPFGTRAQRWLAGRALAGAHTVGVREMVSGELAHDLGLPQDRVRVVPDLALALPAAPADAEPVRRLLARLATAPRPWVGLTVRAWRDAARVRSDPNRVSGAERAGYLTAVIGLCRHVRGRYGGTVVVWPQSLGPGPLEDDRIIARELVSTAGDAVVCVEDEIPPDVLKTAYAAMDVCVATRLHSALVAMASGVPALVIDYWGPKALGIMAQLGQARFVLPYAGLQTGSLCRLFDALWTERAGLREALLRVIPPLVADIDRAVRALVGDIGGSGLSHEPDADRTLSVLLVGLNSSFGGVEQHLLDLSRGLVARGHRVALVAPRHSTLARLAHRLDRLVIHEVPRSPRSVPIVRRLIARRHPDIVHLHSPRASVFGRLAARLLPASHRRSLVVLSSAHGWISGHLRFRQLMEAVYVRTAGWEDGMIAVAGAVRTILEDHGYRGPVWVVPNGLDPNWRRDVRSQPRRPGAPLRFGYFGRLSQEKGLCTLIDALQRLARQDYQVTIHGEGPMRAEIDRRIAACGLGERVHLTGEVPADAVAGLMAACHVVVLPSLQEGCPYVLLEALGLGLPVLACAVGGVTELIVDGKNGLLVPPGEPKALAAAIERFIDDHGFLERCRHEAGARATAYTADDMVERILSVYRDAFAARPAARGTT